MAKSEILDATIIQSFDVHVNKADTLAIQYISAGLDAVDGGLAFFQSNTPDGPFVPVLDCDNNPITAIVAVASGSEVTNIVGFSAPFIRVEYTNNSVAAGTIQFIISGN